jgi:hypothetical protein
MHLYKMFQVINCRNTWLFLLRAYMYVCMRVLVLYCPVQEPFFCKLNPRSWSPFKRIILITNSKLKDYGMLYALQIKKTHVNYTDHLLI